MTLNNPILLLAGGWLAVCKKQNCFCGQRVRSRYTPGRPPEALTLLGLLVVQCVQGTLRTVGVFKLVLHPYAAWTGVHADNKKRKELIRKLPAERFQIVV